MTKCDVFWNTVYAVLSRHREMMCGQETHQSVIQNSSTNV